MAVLSRAAFRFGGGADSGTVGAISHTYSFGTRRVWLPLAASFGVYLLPLAGPHALWLLGEMLYGELTARSGHQDPAWLAADLAVAVAAQAVVAVVVAWWLRGSWTRAIALVVTVPVLAVALQYAYLVIIPSRFLIEPDTAPERHDWVERCVVADAWLVPMKTPVSLPARRFGEWWAQRSNGRYVLVRVPSCEVVEPALPRPQQQPDGKIDFALSLAFSIRGGTTIVERFDTATSRRSWWLLSDLGAHFDRLPVPPAQESAPVLSNSGDALAWIEAVPGSRPPVVDLVRVRFLRPTGRPDAVVSLAPLGAAIYVPLELDTAAREIALWRNDRLMTIDFAGTTIRQAPPVDPIRPQSGTYVRNADAWLAWDAYQDEAAYSVAWSAAGVSRRHRLPRGRAITSAALDPSGRFIAISATTMLSIGRIPDTVYVLRADTGAEVFRRYLPTYTRSSVAFFDGGWFAYSDLDGTHVLRLPAQP